MSSCEILQAYEIIILFIRHFLIWKGRIEDITLHWLQQQGILHLASLWQQQQPQHKRALLLPFSVSPFHLHHPVYTKLDVSWLNQTNNDSSIYWNKKTIFDKQPKNSPKIKIIYFLSLKANPKEWKAINREKRFIRNNPLLMLLASNTQQ